MKLKRSFGLTVPGVTGKTCSLPLLNRQQRQ